MNRLFVLSIICAFVFGACKQETSKMQVTDTGYYYQVIEKGNGPESVQDHFAYFDVEVTSVTGEVVYSSKEQNQPGVMKILPSTETAPNPFGDILLGKNVGDSIHIYLGGDDARGSGFDSLIYKMRFNEMLDQTAFDARLDEERKKAEARIEEYKVREGEVASSVADFYSDYKAGKMDSKIVTSETGLKYVIVKEGTGANFKAGDRASVFYYGVLSRTGEMFDNAYKRGQEFTFNVGQGGVIKGWDEGITYMNKGSEAFLVIPSELGYGQADRGLIKPGDELIFFIEVPE